MNKPISGFLFLLFGMAACNKPAGIGEVTAWKPVYASTESFRQINSVNPQPLVNGGKIAWWSGKIYMVEKGKGLHIISYADPANPLKERFIEVPGCYEVTVRNGFLIVNNGPDLVSLQLTSPSAVQVVSRVPGFFRSIQEANETPPDAQPGDYFECPDFSRGIILRWEKQTVKDPGCRYTF